MHIMATLNREEKVPRSRGPLPSGLTQLVLGVLLGCVLTLLSLWTVRHLEHQTSSTGARELAANAGPVRLTLGRMEGFDTYAPYPTDLRQQERRPLARFCRGVARDAPRSSKTLRDLAFCDLASKRFDAAIAVLEEAVRIEPHNAHLLSDLSALYRERASTEGRPESYVAALGMAEKAITLAPDLAEAAFNRALTLEDLFLYPASQQAWQHYLAIDSRSPWAKEAQIRLLRVSAEETRPTPHWRELLLQAITEGDDRSVRSITAKKPLVALWFFEQQLLPKWAEAVERSDKAWTSRLLNGARQIAQTLAESGRDRIFLRVVREMEPPLGRQETTILVKALLRLRTGQDLEKKDYTSAKREFDTAEEELRSAKSAAYLIVRHTRLYLQSFNPEWRSSLSMIGEHPYISEFPSLEAQRQISLAQLSQMKQESPSEAITAYRRALEILVSIGDESGIAHVQARMAKPLDVLGQHAEAWRCRYHALSWSSRAPMPMIDPLRGAALASLGQRQPEVALDFQNHLIGLLSKVPHPPEENVDALLRRASIEAVLGRRAEARLDFEKALNGFQKLSSPGHHLLAARIDVVRKDIADGEDRTSSISQDTYLPEKESPRLLEERADFDFRRGHVAAAGEDLDRALKQLEQQRAEVTSFGDRVSFLDQAKPLYDRSVALQLNLGRPFRALNIAERFRAQAFFDELRKIAARDMREAAGALSAAPLNWRDICDRVPAHTLVVEFAVIDDQLVTWLILPSGVNILPERPSWSTLSTLVRRLHGDQGGNLESVRQVLEQLDQKLVAPWRSQLHTGDHIVFVPDRSLYEVPFAALVDSRSGRFLVQDHPVGIAPSASEFVALVERDRQLSLHPPTSALLVGNPSFAQNMYPELPRLAEAKEIESLSKLYDGLGTRQLVGKDATPANVLAALSEAEVVHLAAHAIQDAKDPGHTRLVLSAKGTDPGDLSARDILGLHSNKIRLVMLAACETQSGPVSPSEGPLSLASAFLAAGVPAVVGSLRAVEDQRTAQLSIRFHQELRRGVDALSALRIAQLEEINRQGGRFDWTWAGFQVLGGVAERHPGDATQAEPGEGYAARH